MASALVRYEEVVPPRAPARRQRKKIDLEAKALPSHAMQIKFRRIFDNQDRRDKLNFHHLGLFGNVTM